MKKTCILFFVMAAALASCQKELSTETNSGRSAGLTGTWNFVSMSVKSTITQNAVMAVGDTMNMVAYSDYVTTNNKGVIVIDASTMRSQGITYTVDAIARSYFYTNRVLIDSLVMPYRDTLSPPGETISYKSVGSDSLYFANGAGVFINGSGTATFSTIPTGFRYTISGKRMTMQNQLKWSVTDNTQGMPVTMGIDQASTIVLERQ